MELLLLKLIPDWAPNIHPMLVHFPIAILGIAIFFDFVSFFMKRERKWWTEEATAFLYGIGALAAVIVYYTGTLAADSVNASPQAEQVMGHHASWAWWTIWFYGIYAIARIVTTWWTNDRHRLKFHVGFFLLSLIGMYFLYETGEHGAEMVFGYGLGTGQLVENHSPEAMPSQSPGFHEEGDGVIWVIGDDAPKDLTDHFTFLQGDAASVNASVAHQGEGHVLKMEDPDFFFVTNGSSYTNMQMQLALTPGEYKGDIVVAHNVHDAQNYAYMALHSDGTAQLGRYENGEESVLEEGSFDWNSMKSLKISVSGDHIKGYVNGEQILHAHSDQTGPGAVGLKLEGSGSFAFSQMKITQIAGEEHEHGDEEHHEEEAHSH